MTKGLHIVNQKSKTSICHRTIIYSI